MYLEIIMKLFVCAEGKAGENERSDFIKKGKYIQYICIGGNELQYEKKEQ